jgi:hypothetical protein
MIDDDDECGTVGGMRIGRGNRSTWRKPAPVPLCLSQIPHDLTWSRSRVATVESQHSIIVLNEIREMLEKCRNGMYPLLTKIYTPEDDIVGVETCRINRQHTCVLTDNI